MCNVYSEDVHSLLLKVYGKRDSIVAYKVFMRFSDAKGTIFAPLFGDRRCMLAFTTEWTGKRFDFNEKCPVPFDGLQYSTRKDGYDLSDEEKAVDDADSVELTDEESGYATQFHIEGLHAFLSENNAIKYAWHHAGMMGVDCVVVQVEIPKEAFVGGVDATFFIREYDTMVRASGIVGRYLSVNVEALKKPLHKFGKDSKNLSNKALLKVLGVTEMPEDEYSDKAYETVWTA